MNTRFKSLISQYIKAKDNNKPHLMNEVFAEPATLKMLVQTDNISFPAEVEGSKRITQTLVSEFNNKYENIYTLCLSDTVQQQQNNLKCRWVVCMTEKASGSLRLGYGDYLWHFTDNTPALVNDLTITIENMTLLPQELQPQVLSWFDRLPCPWALSSELQKTVPDIELLITTLKSLYQTKDNPE
ncbi:hypothetical protein [Neptunomonas japonica]|uniref:hypothetical protein n=1 Tax=Neptunomonas japonica TaxID=417574 RepID=UPI0003FFF3D3|nr:hypothetical protein [Neptunomonas japonica]